MNSYIGFLNKKNNFLLLFAIIIFIKLFSFYTIQEKRELPIEPDDSYFYYAQAILTYEDHLRERATMQSLKDIVFSTYEKEKSDFKQDVADIGTIERIFTPQYFMYSKLVGFFALNTNLDYLNLWWLINYFTQILILISSLSLIQTYLKNENIYLKFTILISSFFLVLSIQHHILATPLTIGACLFLTTVYFVKSKNIILNYICYFFNFLSLHFHPGVFLISCIFIASYFVLYLFFKKKIYLFNFLGFALPVIIALLIERIFYLSGYNLYLGLFENIYTGQAFAQMNNYFDIYNFNHSATTRHLFRIMEPLVPFIFHERIFIGCIYIFSILIIYKKNKELFFLNFFSVILIFLGNFYFLSITKPGTLIEYTAQGFIPIMMLTIFKMYFVLGKKINEKFNFEKPVILTFLVLIIFIFNTAQYSKTIQGRTERYNYENITNEIIKFNDDLIKNKDEGIIIGDKLVLFMFFSNIHDTNIYLDDKYRGENKPWTVNKEYKIKGYIGRIDKKNKNILIKNDVFVMNKRYTFKNKKLFQNFYFLYN